MKKEKVIENLKKMADTMEKEIPLCGEVKRDDEFYRKLRTLKKSKDLIENMYQKVCTDCGENMVCPKCTPVIEKTNSIIIRHKDTDYNGGYPNALAITPLYTNASGQSISCATITGDNFFHPKNVTAGYTYMERGTIENVAHVLANLDIETWCRLFGFPKNRMKAAEDIQKLLKEYVEVQHE